MMIFSKFSIAGIKILSDFYQCPQGFPCGHVFLPTPSGLTGSGWGSWRFLSGVESERREKITLPEKHSRFSGVSRSGGANWIFFPEAAERKGRSGAAGKGVMIFV